MEVYQNEEDKFIKETIKKYGHDINARRLSRFKRNAPWGLADGEKVNKVKLSDSEINIFLDAAYTEASRMASVIDDMPDGKEKEELETRLVIICAACVDISRKYAR